MNSLSPKQRKFAQAVASGANYTAAYRQVYSSRCKPATARSEASRLANHPRVAEAIERIRQPLLTAVQQAYLATVQSLLQQCQTASTVRERNQSIQMLRQMSDI